MSVIIRLTNSAAQLINADQMAIAVVSDCLSYDVEGAEFTAGFKMGTWNGKSTFLKYPHLVFEAGLTWMVKRSLNENGIPVSIDDTRDVIDICANEIDLAGIEFGQGDFDYQLRAVEALAKSGRGVIQVATGGGKTEIGIAATQYFGLKTLFLTHKLDLVRQTRKRYATRLGRQVGMISEGDWMPSDITVATVQTIMSHWGVRWRITGIDEKGKPCQRAVMADDEKRAKKVATTRTPKLPRMVKINSMKMVSDGREKVLPYLEGIEFLIVDEAHRSSADSFFKIITSCRNAYYRASLTATPLMKASREDNLKLIASSGDVIYRIRNKDLIDRGILAEPHFRYVEVPAFKLADGRHCIKKTPWPIVYKAGIVENDLRNKMIVEECSALIEKGRRTVVLVKEIAHGETITQLLLQSGIRCVWISGKDKGDRREEALRQLRENEIDAIVASTILDEGLDEDAISAIILAGGGKAKIALFQRVGRAMRARKGDDLKKFGNTAEVIDFIDQGDHRLKEHSAQRYAAVVREAGWIVDGVDLYEGRQKRLAFAA